MTAYQKELFDSEMGNLRDLIIEKYMNRVDNPELRKDLRMTVWDVASVLNESGITMPGSHWKVSVVADDKTKRVVGIEVLAEQMLDN